MSHYLPPRRRTLTSPPSNKRISRHVFAAATLVLLLTATLLLIHKEPTARAETSTQSQSVTGTKQIDQAAIAALINAHATDQVGVAVRNIATAKTDTYGVDAPFMAASTTKVLSAVAYYHLVENGRLSLSTKLGSFPAWFQIKQMIVNSSNDSWHFVSNEIGNANLQAYATEIGLDFTQGPNTMSPSSMSLLLAKLYSGKLLNKEHTKTLLSYMKKTNNETLIPAAVGKGITTYHKYGDLEDELHDAAVLVHGTTAYAVVIYTKGTGSVASRTTLIHNLTKSIIAAYNI